MSQTQNPPPKQAPRRAATAVSPFGPENRRFLIVASLWILGILLFTFFSYRRFFAAPGGTGLLTDPDAMDYAQIARNIVNGHGYATSILRPLAITLFPHTAPDHSGVAPDISRAPLYPLLLMLVFLGHGRHGGDNLVVWVSLLLFLLNVLAVYRLARAFFPAPSQVWVALLSMGLYGIGGETLGYALLGLPVALASLLVTLLVLALFRAAETPKRPATFRSALWVGILLGFCYLTQYSLIVLAVPVLFYLFFSRSPVRAWAGVGACVLGFFIITLPWLYRNMVVCGGDPFFTLLSYGLMSNTPQYPGSTTIYRSVAPPVGPLAYFYTHLADMIAREGRGLSFYRSTLLQGFNFFLLAGAAASLLWRTADSRLNAVRACVAVGILLIIVSTSIFQPSVRMIVPFSPFITVAAVGFVFSIISQQGWDDLLQRTALWGLGLLVAGGAFIQFLGQSPPPADVMTNGLSVLSSLNLTQVDNPNHQAGNAVISDAPWEVAWRLNVPAVWLPADNNAYQAVLAAAAQSQVPVSAMLLTPMLADYSVTEGEATPWVLLSTHPSAQQDNQAAQQRMLQEAKIVQTMIADHNPRVHQIMQPPYTAASLQVQLDNTLSQMQTTFQTNYGSISQVLEDFSPYKTVQEADHYNSTVFLSRNMSAARPGG